MPRDATPHGQAPPERTGRPLSGYPFYFKECKNELSLTAYLSQSVFKNIFHMCAEPLRFIIKCHSGIFRYSPKTIFGPFLDRKPMFWHSVFATKQAKDVQDRTSIRVAMLFTLRWLYWSGSSLYSVCDTITWSDCNCRLCYTLSIRLLYILF